jgi:phage shock protein PspC (stress-responsive transcriptional regulator)
MSSYPPPPQYRKLQRSRNDRVIGGVCGGLANYVNMDPNLMRILTVILAVMTGGAPVLVYLVALFVMPDEPAPGVDGTPPSQPSVNTGWTYDPYPGMEQQGTGAYDAPYGNPTRPMQHGVPPQASDPGVWGPAGAPWEQPQQPQQPQQERRPDGI